MADVPSTANVPAKTKQVVRQPFQDVCLTVARDSLDLVLETYPIRRSKVPSTLLPPEDLRYSWLDDLWTEIGIEEFKTGVHRYGHNPIRNYAKTGKSRMLHELSLLLQNDPSITTITTSFYKSAVPILRRSPVLPGSDGEVETTLAIAARVISEVTNTQDFFILRALHESIHKCATAHKIPIGALRYNLMFAATVFNHLISAILRFEHANSQDTSSPPSCRKVVILIDDAHNCIAGKPRMECVKIPETCVLVWTERVSTKFPEPLTENGIKPNFTIKRPTEPNIQQILDKWIPVALPSWANIQVSNPVLAHRILALLTCVIHSPWTTQALIDQLVPHEHDLNFFTNPNSIAQLLRLPSVAEDAADNDALGVTDYFDMTTRCDAPSTSLLRMQSYIAQEIVSNDCDTSAIWRVPIRELINFTLAKMQHLAAYSRNSNVSELLKMVVPFCSSGLVTSSYLSFSAAHIAYCTAQFPNSRENMEAFLQMADRYVFTEDLDVIEVALHHDDAACGMWMLRTIEKPIVLVVDTVTSEQRHQINHARRSIDDESARHDGGDQDLDDINVYPQDQMLARYWEYGVCEIATRMKASWRANSLAEAFAMRQVAFLTVRPHKRDDVLRDISDFGAEANKEETASLLGPFFRTILAIRELKATIAEHR